MYLFMQFYTGDGELGHKEFIDIMKGRITRGLEKVSYILQGFNPTRSKLKAFQM